MEEEIGKVTHYYDKIGVAIVELSKKLNVGEKIAIRGSESGFEQSVSSMQIEHKDVSTAKAGDAIGIKVEQKAREGDKVFRLS